MSIDSEPEYKVLLDTGFGSIQYQDSGFQYYYKLKRGGIRDLYL